MTLNITDAFVKNQNWQHAGFECRTIRHPFFGHWCGYVGVGRNHWAYGKDYDDVEVDVHGGLTYATDHEPSKKPDGLWWLGFDTAHAGDAMLYDSVIIYPYDTYKDAAFVVEETNRLAKQLAASHTGS